MLCGLIQRRIASKGKCRNEVRRQMIAVTEGKEEEKRIERKKRGAEEECEALWLESCWWGLMGLTIDGYTII